MRTAQQRLAEIERKQILLIKKARIEETRKTQKVGEFVREHMPNVEASQEFLAWLRTDIDKALFGVTIDKRERMPRGEKASSGQKHEEVKPKSMEPKVANKNRPSFATEASLKGLPEAVQAKVSALTKKPEPSPLTGGAGDSIRRRLAGQI